MHATVHTPILGGYCSPIWKKNMCNRGSHVGGVAIERRDRTACHKRSCDCVRIIGRAQHNKLTVREDLKLATTKPDAPANDIQVGTELSASHYTVRTLERRCAKYTVKGGKIQQSTMYAGALVRDV